MLIWLWQHRRDMAVRHGGELFTMYYTGNFALAAGGVISGVFLTEGRLAVVCIKATGALQSTDDIVGAERLEQKKHD